MSKDVKNLSSDIKNLTAEEIRNMASDPSNEEFDDIENLFNSYIFYRTLKDGTKECFCSHCKEHYIFDLPRTYTEADVIFLDKKHNESAFCPKCGCPCVMKSVGRIKTGKSLYEERRVTMVEVKDFNTVLLKCYYATKTYFRPWYGVNDNTRFLSQAEVQLSAVYLLTPGQAIKVRLDGWWYGPTAWNIYKTHGEPFKAMFGGDTSYSFIGAKHLENSFLKYALRDKPLGIGETIEPYNPEAFHSRCVCSFLSYFSELPAMEVLLKLGWNDPVEDAVLGHILNKNIIDWQKLKPWEIFKMDKVQYKEFEKYVLKKAISKDYKFVLKVYKILNKYAHCGMKEAAEFADKCSYYDRFAYLIPLLKLGYTPTKIYNYLNKQKQNYKIEKTFYEYQMWSEYGDYLSMAQEMEYDLKQEVVAFPKDLKKAHDRVNKLLTMKKNEAVEKANKEQVKKHIKKYEYSNEEFSIIVPKTVREIVEEGQRQQHCVGGYADRHFNGTLCICFLRKNSEIDKALFTIEMRDKTCVQIQGKMNKRSIKTEPEAEAFFNEWLEWVKNGSKKNKKKKTAVSAA